MPPTSDHNPPTPTHTHPGLLGLRTQTQKAHTPQNCRTFPRPRPIGTHTTTIQPGRLQSRSHNYIPPICWRNTQGHEKRHKDIHPRIRAQPNTIPTSYKYRITTLQPFTPHPALPPPVYSTPRHRKTNHTNITPKHQMHNHHHKQHTYTLPIFHVKA